MNFGIWIGPDSLKEGQHVSVNLAFNWELPQQKMDGWGGCSLAEVEKPLQRFSMEKNKLKLH